MVCDGCGKKLRRRMSSSSNPYEYKPAGLDGVRLCGVAVYACQECNAESAAIPQVQSLHEQIAISTIKRSGRLSGAQVRFLRKNAGISAKEFSQLLGISASHLSRVENGKTSSLGEPTDRLVRTLTAIACTGPEIDSVLELLRHRSSVPDRLIWVRDNDGWNSVAS